MCNLCYLNNIYQPILWQMVLINSAYDSKISVNTAINRDVTMLGL